MRMLASAAVIAAALAPAALAAQSYDVVKDFGSSSFSYSYGSLDGVSLSTPLVATSGCYDRSALSCYNVTGANDTSLPLVAKNTGADPVNFYTVTVPTDQLLLHPGSAAVDSDVLVSFKVPTTGIYTIQGAFSRLDNTTSGTSGGAINDGVFAQVYRTIATGTGTSGAIFTSGTTLEGYGVAPGTTSSFNISQLFNANDIISFGVFNNANYSYDSTGLRATISTGAVPEPATWAMMVLGFGAVGFGLRRRRTSVRVTYA